MNKAENKSIFSILTMTDSDLQKIIVQKNLKRAGPGGQRANKKSSAIELAIPSLNIKSIAKKYRLRQDNYNSALRKLKIIAACQNRELPSQDILLIIAPYLKTKQININKKNPKRPLLIAVLTAYFHYYSGSHKKTADKLNISNSSLVKFIKDESYLQAEINMIRNENNLFNF